jgi:hypothetical protein
LNFFAFYFGGIRVDFLRFALYFGGIWLCIPFGTTFEQKTYTALPYERLFVALATYAAFRRTTFCSFEDICALETAFCASATFWTP